MTSELLRWHDAFCNDCRVMRGQSPYTIAGYRATIKSFVQFTGARQLSEVTIPRVESWICKGTAERDWSPVTSRGRIRYMILFAKWLVKRSLLPNNPLEGIGIPRVPRKIPKHLSRGKAEELLRFVRNHRFRTRFEGARAYAIVAMFMYSGIRRSELLKLEMHDVDFENQLLSVRQGKGGKDRLIPILPQLDSALTSYLSFRREDRFRHSGYFFIGRNRHGQMPLAVLRRMIKKVRDACGIYFAPHMLRHTFATLMLEGGCDIFSLSKLMGHSNIKTTTLYLSASVEHLREQAMRHPVL